MKNIVTGRVVGYEILNCSFYGNPRYSLTIETSDGDLLRGKTKTDGGIGYCCLNNTEQQHKWEYHITRTGNIIFDRMD